ncbi:pirin family protein [Taibaiella soli]|uniref:Pirin family protein n=1 Tax=Taibaiella soli TaxID=1649169 RepID=A0A2W2B9A3_9BACT|nr:pirin family protein [Taibaiella soli]PZF72829.1 pirin family protein [Taibaiella soli]
MSQNIFHEATTRGHASHGWLDSFHTFSFAGYHNPERVHFGALRVLNDDTVSGGEGFGRHPHDNMEIISIVLDGALEHKDSMGNTQAMPAGEVQVMSAGTGVAHSEYNHNKDRKVKFLQIWIFPDERNVTPRYDQKMFDAAERKNQLQTLVSPVHNDDNGLKIHQNAWIYRTDLDAGKAIDLTLKRPESGLYAFLINGNVKINGQEMRTRDGFGITDTDTIHIEALGASDLLLLEVPVR